MNELALFAGAGGGILGTRLLGWRVVCAVEIDPYCREVLLRRQEEGILEPFPVWDDVRTFNGRAWRDRVDVITAGFPCQDISAAGKGKGLDGERSGLWGETIRIIREARSHYALLENSPMLTARGLGRVLTDLAESGYDARWRMLSAAELGAPHKRNRIWIVAHSTEDRRGFLPHDSEERGEARTSGSCDNGIDPHTWKALPAPEFWGSIDGPPYWLGPSWRALGNMQVPAVVAAAWRLLGGRSE